MFEDIDIQERIPEEIRAFIFERHYDDEELEQKCCRICHAIEEAEYWLVRIEILVEELEELKEGKS